MASSSSLVLADDLCLMQTTRGIVQTKPDEKAEINVTGTDAEVRFVRYGQDYLFKMTHFNVYTDDARITAWTEDGLVTIKRKARFFRSRVKGAWATATLHEDGSVSGLFEDNGNVMRIARNNHHFLAPSKKRLRDEKDNTHTTIFTSCDGGHQKVVDNEIFSSGHHNVCVGEKGYMAYEDDSETEAIPRHYEGESSQYPLPTGHNLPWAGAVWYPNCYPGDDTENEMKIGVVADKKAWDEDNAGVQTYMEQSVAEASFVYEKQMNIKLVIDNLHIYQTRSGLTGNENNMNSESCQDDDTSNFMEKKLMDLQKFSRDQDLQSALHLFTGCGNGVGVIGIAWVGSLCNRDGYNTGVNQMIGSDTFLTFAHELGHNFGMYHPFNKEANNPGDSGGIMDYGNGLLDGYYQFNKQYRSPEACPVLEDSMNHCEDRFGVQVPTFAPTPIPTITPKIDDPIFDDLNFLLLLLEIFLRIFAGEEFA